MRASSRACSVLVLVLLAGGCGGGSRPSPPDDSLNAAASSSPVVDDAATLNEVTAADRRYLERGIDGVTGVLAGGRPLQFRFAGGPDGTPYIEGVGAYEAGPGRWWASARFDPTALGQAGPSHTMHARSFGRDLWMQMESWPEPQRGCWLQLDRGQVPLGQLAMRAGEPVYVSVLSGLVAGPRDGEVMTGGLGLQYALRLLTGQLLQRIDLTEVGRGHVVPVDLTFEDGRVATVLVRGDAVRETLAVAGAVVPSSDEEPIDEVLDMLDVRLEYGRADGAASAYRPPAGTIVRAGADGCRAG